jgi:hypothetical protein
VRLSRQAGYFIGVRPSRPRAAANRGGRPIRAALEDFWRSQIDVVELVGRLERYAERQINIWYVERGGEASAMRHLELLGLCAAELRSRRPSSQRAACR